MKPPLRIFSVACAFALGVSGAQSAGVAVFKEQVYHLDSSALAVAYSRIVNSKGPHLRVVIGNRNFDVLRSKLVAHVELPGSIPEFIDREAELQPLRRTLEELKEFSARYPRSTPLLGKSIDALARHIGRFEAGEVRFEGIWISRNDRERIMETRGRETRARVLAEIEKLVFEAAQRDKGLVLHDGKWMTPREREQYPSESHTELSDCIAPLWTGDPQGARFALANLTSLASRQTGAAKIRTERLATAVRNLYHAESRVTRQLMACSRDNVEAATLERKARIWLKPNAFGTVHTNVASEARDKATRLRERSADKLASRRRELLDQLREVEIVTGDFEKLREHRVVMVLTTAVRAVASRHFTSAEFEPSFPDESLATLRNRIRGGSSPSPAL